MLHIPSLQPNEAVGLNSFMHTRIEAVCNKLNLACSFLNLSL